MSNFTKIIDAASEAKSNLKEMLLNAVSTDGADHKQWYLEQIAEAFDIELPDHDEGVIP